MTPTHSERRLTMLVDEREIITRKSEALLEEAGDKSLTESQEAQATMYRERAGQLDIEIDQISGQLEADRAAEERSREIRRAMAGLAGDGVDLDDGVIYRTMAEYARDVILTGAGREVAQIQALVGKSDIEQAEMRQELIKRVPANTLSSNVGGLTPQQHISQIFQVIDDSRPLVATAQRADLERGTLSYPKVTTRPVVAVQGSEKTEAGNTGMVIDMLTTTASTYLGGGDLSWQAINWSTPNALDLWFRLVAADYALKTEQDAAQAMQHSAFGHIISSPLGATPTFAQFMTAVGAGYAKVFTDSSRIANTIFMAPDRYGYILGLTSDQFSQFVSQTTSAVGPVTIVVTRGMDAGVITIGDRDGLLVAETPGAPVELRVVEPAIGGVEVGLIGAFEAVVVDPGAFSMITTAS